MQTFLPHPSFEDSLRCLDYKRLGKQRVEGVQIVTALRWHEAPEKFDKTPGWVNHPVVLMWRGHASALKSYVNISILLWLERGYKNTLPLYVVPDSHRLDYPRWFGDERFHSSHRARLLAKSPDWYSQFGWSEEPSDNYFWPPESTK